MRPAKSTNHQARLEMDVYPRELVLRAGMRLHSSRILMGETFMIGSTSAPAEIPVYRPYLGPEVQEAAQNALAAGWLGMGKLSKSFEEGIERYLGLAERKVVSTNS
jgi:hypothetical protein